MMSSTSTNAQLLVDCQHQYDQLKKKTPFRWSTSTSSLHAHFTREQATADNKIDKADDDSMAVMTDMFIWSTYIEQDEEDERSDQELLQGSSQRSNSTDSTSKSSKKIKKDYDDDTMKDTKSRRSKTSSKSSSKKSHGKKKRKEERRLMKEELPNAIIFAGKKQCLVTSKTQISPAAA